MLLSAGMSLSDSNRIEQEQSGGERLPDCRAIYLATDRTIASCEGLGGYREMIA